MTIRQKTLAILAAALLGLTAAFFAFHREFSFRDADQTDRSVATQELLRVYLALQQEQRDLLRAARDWAAWNDAYRFMEDGNIEFIEDNLTTQDIATFLEANDLVLVAPSGHLYYSRSVLPHDKTPASLPPEVPGLFGPRGPFFPPNVPLGGRVGFLWIGHHAALVAAVPVQDSQRSGARRGILFLSRHLDESHLRFLRTNTQVSFDILPYGALAPVDPEDPTPDPLIRHHAESPRTQAESLLVRGLQDAPLLWIRTRSPRTHYLQAERNLQGSAAVLAVLALGLGVAATWTLDRFALRRIQKLGEEVRAIGDREDPSGRVGLDGSDEVGELAERINRTLEALEQSHAEKRLADAAVRCAHQDLTAAYEKTLEGWSFAMDLRDKETEGHTRRVMDRTLTLARHLGYPEGELVHLRRGALLHDIGKLGIPDAILLKPGPLTEAEWAVMRRHPEMAYEMLSPIRYLHPALSIPYCHPERWDGTGYPQGLRGEQIPRSARLFAVVDIWDALSSDRPYRAAWPQERVYEHLRSLRGTHLDPRAVEAFLAAFPLGS